MVGSFYEKERYCLDMDKDILSYSIAIRTLGKSGDLFRRELESIRRQTIQPDSVFVYIAEGYELPKFTDGVDRFIRVKKGMASQRLLDYDEIVSECIFFMDDDVELADDAAERLLHAMIDNKADCICADNFHNQEMNILSKVKNILINSTFPFFSKRWAQRIGLDGALSYNCSPQNRFYETQSGEGPAWIVRKSVYKLCNLKAELWLDNLGFAYAEDQIQIFKLFSNGFKCGMLYGAGVTHLDGGTSSQIYKNSPDRLYKRSQSIFINWYRMRLSNSTTNLFKLSACVSMFALRSFLIQASYIIAAIRFRDAKIITYHIKGIADGVKFVRCSKFKDLPPYILL